jgi:hypothetical protein
MDKYKSYLQKHVRTDLPYNLSGKGILLCSLFNINI